MLRTLLTDRFTLRARKEIRPVPVYALRFARAGRLGAGLRPSTAGCIEYRGTPPFFSQNGVMTLRNGGPITQLIRDLQGTLDRPVVDEQD